MNKRPLYRYKLAASGSAFLVSDEFPPIDAIFPTIIGFTSENPWIEAAAENPTLGSPLLLFDAAIDVREDVGNPAENLDSVQGWGDQGTAGADAIQNTTLNKPFYLTTGALDGYPQVDHLPDQHMIITGVASAVESWTLYAAVYDNAATGNAYLLDVETGPLRFALSSVSGGDNLALFDGDAWRVFGASQIEGQVLTWVLDGAAGVCRAFRGRTQIGTDQPYTPRGVGGDIGLAGEYNGLSGFIDAAISRLALYPAAHNADLRTQVWDAWQTDFPTYL